MKRRYWLFFMLFSLVVAGVVLGQEAASANSFALVQQIGRVKPQGMQYDPNFDRFVMVDTTGRLLLVDAATYETQHVLHEGAAYNAYKFSHDGRFLALALERRVELWDTQNGTIAASINIDSALSITGPLQFSENDDLLLFSAVVPAPQSIRRSENDTSINPWIWDVDAALDLRTSILPNRADAYTFFELRNGFVLGPNYKAIAPYPGRIQIIDVSNVQLPVVAEFETQRNERDPIDVWFSQRGDQMYFHPLNESTLIQINTENNALLTIPLRIIL
jgi:hypothetical protein